ncbi:MAG TPA: glycosyltransferase family 4 protein [Thermoanaerobaculia bacterium]
MRVLLVANTLPPRDLSGAGEQVLQLAAGLRELGHEVEVLGRGQVFTAAGEPRRAGVAGPKVLFPVTVLAGAWHTLRRLRPHVVQVHESDAALVALLVAVARRFLRPRPRLVALLQVSYLEEMRAVRPLRHGGRVLGRPGSVEKRFLWTKAPLQVVLGWLTSRLAEFVLAPSRRTADEIERDYRVRGVRVLPNVTRGLPVPPAADGDEIEPGYLLYVGRLRIRKGVEVLLEAMAQLVAEGRAARLLIAGSGEQEASLRRRTHELGLAGAVRLLGRCDASRVRRLLSGARCLVVPSIYEGMPLVILEAMAESVPVVASAVSGIPEVVVDGETGWLVPPEDPPRLASALREALDDAAEARRRGEAGRRRVTETFTPRAAARRWVEEIEHLRAGVVSQQTIG